MENEIDFQVNNITSGENLNNSFLSAEISEKQNKHCYCNENISEVLKRINFLNNMVPFSMPEYNFNIDEINGEYYYKPDGTPLLIREYDSDIIRDYYCQKEPETGKLIVSRILEHDKNTGRLRSKIEKTSRKYHHEMTSIIIFDTKINNKYIIIQLSEGGIVNNFSEFSGKGKSFQTLFRDIHTYKPLRYVSGTDSEEKPFEMLDCILNSSGEIVKLKCYANNK